MGQTTTKGKDSPQASIIKDGTLEQFIDLVNEYRNMLNTYIVSLRILLYFFSIVVICVFIR